jgi:hypothetical protein
MSARSRKPCCRGEDHRHALRAKPQRIEQVDRALEVDLEILARIDQARGDATCAAMWNTPWRRARRVGSSSSSRMSAITGVIRPDGCPEARPRLVSTPDAESAS